MQRRIAVAAANLTFDVSTIRTAEVEGAALVMAGDTPLLSLSEADTVETVTAGKMAGARLIAARIQDAIRDERERKSPRAIAIGAGYSVLATLFLFALLLLFRWAYPRIYRRIKAMEGKYVKTLRIQSFELVNSARITGLLTWLASASRIALTLLALYVYIPLVFSFFPWTSNWAPRLFSYIVNPLLVILHVVTDYLPNLFFIAAIAVVTRYSLRIIRFFFAEIGAGTLQIDGFYREWAEPTYKLVRFLVLAFALVMVFPYLPGSSSPAFQGISVFLGILLSLGSSSAIANIVAGVVLTYMRPFVVGDRVKISDTVGDVIEKNLLVTRVRTIKNVDTTIPNSMVLGSHIVNYSSTAQREGLILNTTVTIGYDVPWKKVHQLLVEAARRTQLVDQERRPFVLQTALNDFYVAYELNAYTTSPNKMAVIYSELHQHIQDCFNENGVEIMSPHYSAVRDGNETTIPPASRPEGYETPRFRLDSGNS